MTENNDAQRRLNLAEFSMLPNDANARLIESAPEMLEALANLCTYANGKMGKNPYSIPEYMAALSAIGKAIGYTGDKYDTLEKYRKAEGENK